MNTRTGIIYAVLALVAVIGLWIALASAVWGFRVATAGLYGRGQAYRQIQSAPFRIAAYDHFFDLCASIQANEAALDALGGELTLYEPASKDHARVAANITGVTAQRQRSIADYNADARKDYTIGQFRDSSLPYRLDANDYPEGGHTSCEP